MKFEFDNIEELPYIAPDEARTKVFETLTTEKEIAKFKNALGMLKQNNQLWLCIAILRYRHNGYISKNNNPFMIDIFKNLVGIKTAPKVVEKVVTKEVVKEVPVKVFVPTAPSAKTPAKDTILSRFISKFI